MSSAEMQAIAQVSESRQLLASSPGHPQILSPRLRDKIWEWPGDEARHLQC